MAITFVCTPVLMLASVDSIALPGSTIEIPCEQLSLDERKRLHAALHTAQENIKHMRAAEAGVLLANTMPRPR